jgi:nucleotide-binding universal stress UspA family protein
MEAAVASAWATVDAAAAKLPWVARVRTRVEHGTNVEVLERVGADEDAVAVVVGSGGHGRLRSAIFGSTSGDLIARATRPVLVVPAGALLRLDSAE